LVVLWNVVAPYRLPLLRALSEAFDVTVLCTGYEDDRAIWASTVEGLERVEVRTVGGWVIKTVERDGQEIFENRYLHLNPQLVLELRRARPDAIISNEMGFRTACALLYGRWVGCPVWVMSEVPSFTEDSIGLLRRGVRWVLARTATRWISFGSAATDYLGSLGVDRSRVVQVQNGVDDRLFRGASGRLLDLQPKPVVLFVGRLIKLKGVHFLLRAVSELQEEGLKFSLLIVGAGPERIRLQSLCRELGVADVRWQGEVVPDEMPQVYRSADLLVFPTLRDVWGLVINEALLCGLPVISSRFAGAAEELLPSDNLFDPRDPDEFRDILRKGISGSLPAPDPAALMGTEAVNKAIVEEVHRGVRASRRVGWNWRRNRDPGRGYQRGGQNEEQ
jgi:glycosyltransferase involved in cell wall biosynthesis